MNQVSQKTAVLVTNLIGHDFSAMLPGFNWYKTVSIKCLLTYDPQ